MKRPVSAKAMDNYTVLIQFNDGEQRLFDAKPFLSHPFFAPLKNPVAFNAVSVNDYTIEWENGCDIAPHELLSHSVKIE